MIYASQTRMDSKEMTAKYTNIFFKSAQKILTQRASRRLPYAASLRVCNIRYGCTLKCLAYESLQLVK